MWNFNFFGFEFYYIFYDFFIYSFLGWIYESCIMSIKGGKWVNRGFLNGPIIPIYGLGATLIYICLTPVKNHILLVFICGMLLATFLEYMVSVLLEKLFHARWWDYSEYKLQFQGRIWLVASLFWGVLSILMMTVFQPNTDKLIQLMPRKTGEIVGYIIFAFFVVDLFITVKCIVQLDKAVDAIQKARDEFKEYIENTKLYEMKEEIIEKYENSRFYEIADGIKLYMEEQADKFNERENVKEIYAFKKGMEERLQNFSSKMRLSFKGRYIVMRRLLRAFPNLKFKKGQEALLDLKEWINNKRKK